MLAHFFSSFMHPQFNMAIFMLGFHKGLILLKVSFIQNPVGY